MATNNAINAPLPLAPTQGGTGISSYILGDTLFASAANVLSKLAGNTTAAKQFLSQTGTGVVSASPVWAAIAGADVTGAALTAGNDTNVTLTLGGTPATSLLRAASITAGWTGMLSIARGGTNNSSFSAVSGGIMAITFFNGTSVTSAGPGVFGYDPVFDILKINSGVANPQFSISTAVSGSANSTSIVLNRGDQANGGNFEYFLTAGVSQWQNGQYPASDHFLFKSPATTVLDLDRSGNVSIPNGNLNIANLTASSPVFTDASKNLTSTGVVPVANGGTGTSTVFTTGSVVFAGASGIYTQNNANFFWDNTNIRLGVGVNTPASPLNVKENTTTTSTANGVTIEQAGTGDATLQFLLTGSTRWMSGIDNSDSDNFKISNGTDLALSTDFVITTGGNITQPRSSAFLAYLTTTTGGITGNNVFAQVVFDTVSYDQNANYSTGTGLFTAPVTGRYQLSSGIEIRGLTASVTEVVIQIVTTTLTYFLLDVSGAGRDTVIQGICANGSVAVAMSAGDTAQVKVLVSGLGANTATVTGTNVTGATNLVSYFSGCLVA